MGELLNPAVLNIGASGLVVAFVLAMLLGWLRPRSMVREQLAQANKTVELWQRIAQQADERADLAQKQSGELLAGMDTIEKLVRSIVPTARETH